MTVSVTFVLPHASTHDTVTSVTSHVSSLGLESLGRAQEMRTVRSPARGHGCVIGHARARAASGIFKSRPLRGRHSTYIAVHRGLPHVPVCVTLAGRSGRHVVSRVTCAGGARRPVPRHRPPDRQAQSQTIYHRPASTRDRHARDARPARLGHSAEHGTRDHPTDFALLPSPRKLRLAPRLPTMPRHTQTSTQHTHTHAYTHAHTHTQAATSMDVDHVREARPRPSAAHDSCCPAGSAGSTPTAPASMSLALLPRACRAASLRPPLYEPWEAAHAHLHWLGPSRCGGSQLRLLPMPRSTTASLLSPMRARVLGGCSLQRNGARCLGRARADTIPKQPAEVSGGEASGERRARCAPSRRRLHVAGCSSLGVL